MPLVTQYANKEEQVIDQKDDDDSPGSQENSSEAAGSQSKSKKEVNAVTSSLKSLVAISKKRKGNLVSDAIVEVEKNIQVRIANLEKKMNEVEKDKDKALANVETWRARQLEAPNYDEVMKRREREWLESETEENEKCLIEMRRYLPQKVAKMSKADLQQQALEAAEQFKSTTKPKKGEDTSLLGIYPSDLAIYLKECSFLHWLVMHPTDIRKSNFLLGDSSQHFQNLEKWVTLN